MLRMQREESKQREEEENAERRGKETERQRETENEQWAQCNYLQYMFNTWNCLYIDNMCSTSRLGLKPSKPTISL